MSSSSSSRRLSDNFCVGTSEPASLRAGEEFLDPDGDECLEPSAEAVGDPCRDPVGEAEDLLEPVGDPGDPLLAGEDFLEPCSDPLLAGEGDECLDPGEEPRDALDPALEPGEGLRDPLLALAGLTLLDLLPTLAGEPGFIFKLFLVSSLVKIS